MHICASAVWFGRLVRLISLWSNAGSSPYMDLPIVLAALALLAGPVLAIIALVLVGRLRSSTSQTQLQELTTRIYRLERQVEQMAAAESAAQKHEPARSGQKPVRIELSPTLEQQPEPLSSDVPPPLPPRPVTPQVSTAPRSGPGAPPLNVAPSTPQKIPLAQRSAPIEMENLIAGRWFYLIGIVALLIAISLGVKYAFDNKWIGPTGRVAIGILLGACMLPWSQWLLARGYKYFSEGIAALGEATLFVSVWAGCQYYSLYGRDVGFAAMIAITAVMAAIAIGRNSQRIAAMSLLGGLLAPILASTGKDAQVILFTYLLFLGAGALGIALKRRWHSLPLIAFVGTQIYFWGWYSEFFHRTSPLERTALFATLFFVLYAALPIRTAMRGGRFDKVLILLALGNEFLYSAALFVLLWPDEKWPLALLFVALAAANVAVARLLPAPQPGESDLPRLLYAGLALTFLTLAVPVRLEGKWITLTFAVEGAILVWTGFRAASNFLRQSGYLLLGISAFRLLVSPPQGGAFFSNPRFGAYLVLIACFAVALASARSRESKVDGRERIEVGFFAIAINVYALIAFSGEFWDYFGRNSTSIDARLAQHLALSVLWTAYASALLLLGVQRASGLLRWQSLTLFGIVVAKVFLYDLSFLERGYKIFSFFVLGAVLLAVSFLYQRKLAREKGNA